MYSGGNMINPWADLAKMKRDFPLGVLVVVDDDVEDGDDDIGGMILKVTDYLIEEGMIELTGENGREFLLYPEEIARHYENQVC
jgi:hypothetical protein